MNYEDIEVIMKVRVSSFYIGGDKRLIGQEGEVCTIRPKGTLFPISVYFGYNISRSFDPEELEKA